MAAVARCGGSKSATELEHAVLWFLGTLRKRKEAYPVSSAERRSESMVCVCDCSCSVAVDVAVVLKSAVY